mmetsp:Transcript_40757/g.97446  ORF Transcript_40757/g.97446 Transcript_40757/m.97446 type:complete len:255 (+) Transcript_40757:3022-3786(+)
MHAKSALRRPSRTALPRPPSGPSLSRANSSEAQAGRPQLPPPLPLSGPSDGSADTSNSSRARVAIKSTCGPKPSATLAVVSPSTSVCRIATKWRRDGRGGGDAAAGPCAAAPRNGANSSNRPSSCLSSHSTRKTERKAHTTLSRPAAPRAQSWCSARKNGRASTSGRRPSRPCCRVFATSKKTNLTARTCMVTRVANCGAPTAHRASGSGNRGMAGRLLPSLDRPLLPELLLLLPLPSKRLTNAVKVAGSDARN